MNSKFLHCILPCSVVGAKQKKERKGKNFAGLEDVVGEGGGGGVRKGNNFALSPFSLSLSLCTPSLSVSLSTISVSATVSFLFFFSFCLACCLRLSFCFFLPSRLQPFSRCLHIFKTPLSHLSCSLYLSLSLPVSLFVSLSVSSSLLLSISVSL